MELLKKRIIDSGIIVSPEILKVDSFINHQIDPELTLKIAEEFVKIFALERITRILTIESSGIAPAVMTGLKLGVPVVFAKKSIPSTLSKGAWTAGVHSFTKNKDYDIFVSSQFLTSSDRVLIIDDFLAHGSASEALISIVHQAGAEIAGVGIVIEKGFQNGGALLRSRGIRVESLAIIESMDMNTVQFRE